QYEMAMSYMRLNDIKQARIELQELIMLSPYSAIAPQVYYQIASLYSLEGNLQEAIRNYDKVMSLYPGSPYSKEAMFEKASILEGAGNLRDALTLYKKLEGVYPNQEALRIRLEGIQGRLKERQVSYERERFRWKR
ncbi:MAG: tetratricopeptide repeat protein, partial [Deltaproteobacteria bacterium]|nr:tetratricopeptide repeat protein [Deltaproteobacteria bacterium]